MIPDLPAAACDRDFLFQDFLRLMASVSLPAKFLGVATSYVEEDEPCPLAEDRAYFISDITRTGTAVTLGLVHPVLSRYRLPTRYAAVVSQDDIDNINTGRVYHTLKMRRCGNRNGYVLSID